MYLNITEVCGVFLYPFKVLYKATILDFIRFNVHIESEAQTIHGAFIIAIKGFINGVIN